MHINRLSLMHSLLSVINDSEYYDSNCVIARYFIEHYNELDRLNIYDMAADCFVSRSSIRRFCQSIGYDNFKNLKAEFSEYDDMKAINLNYLDRPEFRQELTDEIQEMIVEMNKRMNTKEVDFIIDRFNAADKIVMLTSESSTNSIRAFQESMVFCGKFIQIVSESFSDNTLLESLKPQDYLMTISATGVFANASRNMVAACNAYKALVTVNRKPSICESYDKVYYLSGKDRGRNPGVYGKYGINYMYDILCSAYYRKFGTSK